jgi:Asp-tRNA(Asn)/Glu-tRNA(Gln) amidotransferase A subunit family amidase
MPFRAQIRHQARLIRTREISAVELVGLHLDHIESVNPALNAFTEVYSAFALSAAAAADEALASGRKTGPLHGLPVTVKDSFDVEGQPTLSGSKLRLGHKATSDAPAVRLLRESGAILLGKTNTPDLLRSYETDNFITGRTNNPWNVDRTPGGSSGGEAAAIAACLSAGGIGSDGGGSIRVPAHFCGIAGLKPTPGRVPVTGHFPGISNPGGFASVVGPMARSASDLQVLFEAIAGYEPEDPFSVPCPPRRVVPITRIGLWPSFYAVPVESAVADAVQTAARLLALAGFEVEPFAPKGAERAPNAWRFILSELPDEFFRAYFKGRESEAHWTASENSAPPPAVPVSGIDVLKQFAARDRLRAAMVEQMREFPVVLMPVCGITTFPHGTRTFPTPTKDIGLFEAMMPALIWNMYGFPAVTVPIAVTAEGLPVGVQLVGLPWMDETLLDIAVQLEQARGPMPLCPLGQRPPAR